MDGAFPFVDAIGSTASLFLADSMASLSPNFEPVVKLQEKTWKTGTAFVFIPGFAHRMSASTGVGVLHAVDRRRSASEPMRGPGFCSKTHFVGYGRWVPSIYVQISHVNLILTYSNLLWVHP